MSNGLFFPQSVTPLPKSRGSPKGATVWTNEYFCIHGRESKRSCMSCMRTSAKNSSMLREAFPLCWRSPKAGAEIPMHNEYKPASRQGREAEVYDSHPSSTTPPPLPGWRTINWDEHGEDDPTVYCTPECEPAAAPPATPATPAFFTNTESGPPTPAQPDTPATPAFFTNSLESPPSTPALPSPATPGFYTNATDTDAEDEDDDQSIADIQNPHSLSLTDRFQFLVTSKDYVHTAVGQAEQLGG